MLNRNSTFELLLFSTDVPLIKAATQAGINGVIVDWESKGKHDRQVGFDTQINQDTFDDLQRVSKNTNKSVICRINGFGEWTEPEVNQAISGGVSEILLPMVRTPEEVLRTLDFIKDRCPLGILVETINSIDNLQALSKLPLSRVYVGLNDLSIERQLKNIFISIIDGTVEIIRSHFTVPFGFAGLTIPELGKPIPCRLLIAEMARLNCDFTFLRRSFLRDITGRELSVEVPRILAALAKANMRSSEQIELEKQELIEFVSCWDKGFRSEN